LIFGLVDFLSRALSAEGLLFCLKASSCAILRFGFVLAVDRQTGFSEVGKALSLGLLSAALAVKRDCA
jgi:hypothetical protein